MKWLNAEVGYRREQVGRQRNKCDEKEYQNRANCSHFWVTTPLEEVPMKGQGIVDIGRQIHTYVELGVVYTTVHKIMQDKFQHVPLHPPPPKKSSNNGFYS